jgi:hypothetical protein
MPYTEYPVCELATSASSFDVAKRPIPVEDAAYTPAPVFETPATPESAYGTAVGPGVAILVFVP